MWSVAFPPSCCSGSLPSTAAFQRNTAICSTPPGPPRNCNHKGDPWGTLPPEFPSGQSGAALKKAADLLFFLASGSDPCGSSVQVSRTVEWLCGVFSHCLNLAACVLLGLCPPYFTEGERYRLKWLYFQASTLFLRQTLCCISSVNFFWCHPLLPKQPRLQFSSF